MLNNPKNAAKMFKNLLGTQSNLGYYDVRDENKLKLLKDELFQKVDTNKFKIPLPNFNPIQNINEHATNIISPNSDEKNKNQTAEIEKKIEKKEETKPKTKTVKKKIKIKKILYQDYCKFISSKKKNTPCPKKYPVFIGAQFSGKNISCDASDSQNKSKTKSKINYCKLCCKNEV
jgi:hypothetical protein